MLHEAFDTYESSEISKVISIDYMQRKGLLPGHTLKDQKRFIIGALDTAMQIEPGHLSGETLVIHAGTCTYRIPYQKERLETLRRRVNGIHTSSPDHKPSTAYLRPTGKDVALIEKEAQDEVDAYYCHRDSIKRDYLYLSGEGLEKAKQDVDKWVDISNKVDNKEITLESLAPEFNGKVPSHHSTWRMSEHSGRQTISGRLSAAQDYLTNTEKRLREIQKLICDSYPALLRELTEG